MKAKTSITGRSLVRLRTPKQQILALLAVALLTLAACGGGDDDTPPSGNEAEEGAGGGEESVTLQVATMDNSFDPSSLSAPAGGEVTVEVSNEGDNPHTFTIDDPQVDTSSITAGGSATASFTMPDASVTFYCAIHGEDTMSGTIEVS